jgi:hypothetical protein
MSCFICDQPAQLSQGFGDTKRVSCNECGEYAIDGIMIRRLTVYAQHLHTIGMRQWLDEQRAEGYKLPSINLAVAVWN